MSMKTTALPRLFATAIVYLALLLPVSASAATGASDPRPTDGRLFVDVNDAYLTWVAPDEGGAVTGYVVSIDTDAAVIDNPDATPAIQAPVGATADPHYEPPTLEYGAAYYWRVDVERDGAATEVGPRWSFTTEYEEIPGIVADYSPDPSSIYYQSPSIAILPDGTYIASHDVTGDGAPSPRQTAILESTDKGRNWTRIGSVAPAIWSNLFVHNDALYLMGTDGGGSTTACTIQRSDDGGRTWTTATNSTNGVLLDNVGCHTAPVPMVVHNGRIWRAFEDKQDPGEWAAYFRAFMMSAPVDADLLRADSWTMSNPLSFDETNWDGEGWLEGNAVVTPDGEIVDILRVADKTASIGVVETAAIVHISADGTTATFDPDKDFIDFPGGGVKFTIRYDSVSDRYWSLTNKQRDPYAVRNRVALISSPDLIDWEVHDELLTSGDPVFHAWQYIDWVFDGDDIVFVSRTAHPTGDGTLPHGYHDANFTTIHRVDDFRDYAPPPGDDDDDSGGCGSTEWGAGALFGR
ncbi:MAG: exo-alpha-sialidase [Deltaproteobacteria bacterium]|nr:exo-alpha-sialidase [Deltaproteobacteria bacterium]